jgi:hypothetical protein
MIHYTSDSLNTYHDVSTYGHMHFSYLCLYPVSARTHELQYWMYLCEYEREVEIARHENSNGGATVLFQMKKTYSLYFNMQSQLCQQ